MLDTNLIIAFVVGVAVGIAIAFILNIRNVQSVSLDLRRIGIALGVQGFEDKALQSVSQTMTGSAGGKQAGRDLIEHQSNKIEKLAQTVQNIQKQFENGGKLEQESRVYTYKYKGDIPKIHNDVLNAIRDGWYLQSITPLIDYEGQNRLWVVLSRPHDGAPHEIRLVTITDNNP